MSTIELGGFTKLLIVTLSIFFSSSCSSLHGRDIILYELDAQPGESSFDGLAVQEHKNIIYGYVRPFQNEKQDSAYEFAAGRFKYQQIDGILFDRTTHISLPLDIRSRSSWSVNGASCSATLDKDQYHVACREGEVIKNYTFRSGVGITSFEFPCSESEACNFRLVSDKGIFRQVR